MKTPLYLFIVFLFVFFNHKNESVILITIHDPSIDPSNCDKHFGHNRAVLV